MTRTTGLLLIGGAVAICLVVSSVLGVGYFQGGLELNGAILGMGIVIVIVVMPLIAGGVLALSRSRGEQANKAEAEHLRRILDMVKTRGQVSVSDVIIDLQSDQPSVQAMIYKLVGMGVFSGYVNWNEGILYSSEAASLHSLSECKHCGGQVKLAGKGVVKCPFCGTEYFLAV
jgi:hypothetical protein